MIVHDSWWSNESVFQLPSTIINYHRLSCAVSTGFKLELLCHYLINYLNIRVLYSLGAYFVFICDEIAPSFLLGWSDVMIGDFLSSSFRRKFDSSVVHCCISFLLCFATVGICVSAISIPFVMSILLCG